MLVAVEVVEALEALVVREVSAVSAVVLAQERRPLGCPPFPTPPGY